MVAWPVRAPRGSPHPADRNFYSRATWLESRGPSAWRMPSTIGDTWHSPSVILKITASNDLLHYFSTGVNRTPRLCEDIRPQQSVVYLSTCRGPSFLFHFIYVQLNSFRDFCAFCSFNYLLIILSSNSSLNIPRNILYPRKLYIYLKLDKIKKYSFPSLKLSWMIDTNKIIKSKWLEIRKYDQELTIRSSPLINRPNPPRGVLA